MNLMLSFNLQKVLPDTCTRLKPATENTPRRVRFQTISPRTIKLAIFLQEKRQQRYFLLYFYFLMSYFNIYPVKSLPCWISFLSNTGLLFNRAAIVAVSIIANRSEAEIPICRDCLLPTANCFSLDFLLSNSGSFI